MSGAKLGSILVDSQKLDEGQLATALETQHGTLLSIGDVVLNLGFASPEDIAQALAIQLNIPYFELGEDFSLSQEEIGLIPEAVARRLCLIPVRKGDDRTVTVIMADPMDLEAVDTVRSLTKLEVHKAVSTRDRIEAVIDRYYREDAHIERNIQDIVQHESEEEGLAISELESEVDAEQLRVMANDAPVVRFVNLVLMQAVRDRASDIHFEPDEKTVRVRLRVDGVLRELTPPPKSIYPAIVTRIKILSAMDIAERRLPLDGRFSFGADGRTVDVRVSSLPEVHGEKIVLRILDRASVIVGMEEIGFEKDMLDRFKEILELPHGIVLLTGPTGSGKTTTLYSALRYMKSDEKNIQTVEDPVEYKVPGINQMQIKPKIGLDFVNALRSILRQDPDTIMIGEIRDADTARIAMRSALTGHLVLSTLHTNDATSAFCRLRDIGVEPYLIAATVKLVIAQRLVRVICEDCKKPFVPSADDMRHPVSLYPEATDWTFYRGEGCPKCGNTGYKGRRGIFEFLEVSKGIRKLTVSGASDHKIREQAVADGLETLSQNGFQKVLQGVTTIEEVVAVSPVNENP